MSSLRARIASQAIRLVVRRRHWGPSARLVRRARRLFGVPRPYQRWRSFDVTVQTDPPGPVRGEWVVPRGSAPRTILYFHGGGYVACSPGTHRPITAALARLAPARVFAPDYRLAPEAPYPAAVDDAERTYRWLLDRGIVPSSIAVAGDSAGGGLTLALLLRLRRLGVPLPGCGVLFSPWTDLTGSGASVRTNDGRCVMFRPENLEEFASCYAPPTDWRNPEISPVFADLRELPPLYIQVDDAELLFSDAARIDHAVQAAGGRAELAVFSGVFHGWQLLDGLLPESREALERAAEFIAATTGSGAHDQQIV